VRSPRAYVIDVATSLAYVRIGADEQTLRVNEELFETLLDTARRMRRRRLERHLRWRRRGTARAADRGVDVRQVRAMTSLSQAKFAELLSIEVATLRNWEQGRRAPTGPARALLRAIRNNPVDVIKALSE